MIDDDGALTEYLDDHPDVDRQALRRLIARVRKAADDSRRKSESRALFRFLREADDAG